MWGWFYFFGHTLLIVKLKEVLPLSLSSLSQQYFLKYYRLAQSRKRLVWRLVCSSDLLSNGWLILGMFCLSGLLSFSWWTFFRASAFMDTHRCLRLVFCVSLQKTMKQYIPIFWSHCSCNHPPPLLLLRTHTRVCILVLHIPISQATFLPVVLFGCQNMRLKKWRWEVQRNVRIFTALKITCIFYRDDWQSLWSIK